MQNNQNQIQTQNAGFWLRFAAYCIDGILVMIAFWFVEEIVLIATSALDSAMFDGEIIFQYTLSDIVCYVCEVIYFILITYFTGTTVGKRVFKLKVISTKGEKLKLFDVIYRETIGRYLSLMCLGIGYFMVGFRKDKKGLHDILCDTSVVCTKEVKVYPEYQAPKYQYIPTMVPAQEAAEPVNVPVQEEVEHVMPPAQEEENKGDS